MANYPQLNEEQKAAFDALKKFIKHPTANTFVINGYAGTGKTFLMQYFAKWLKEKNHKFKMLASTGRAATVLKGKTGFETKTVHGELYQFSKVNGNDENISTDTIEQSGQMTLQFSLRPPDEVKHIYIVDEASMLSSNFTDSSSFANFGSGVLLEDFFNATGNNKIIFVGDPCQLPPVGQSYSPALDTNWLEEQNRAALSITLHKIERTNSDNDILKLAHAVRDLSLQESWEKYIKLPAKNHSDITLYATQQDLFDSYLERYRSVGSSGALAVARSNKTVQQINKAVRKELYSEDNMPLQVGDILLVTQNNYAQPLTNGDFVTVISLGELRQQAGLNFQNIRIKTALSEKEYDILLSLDILYSQSSNYTHEQMKMLMIDFNQRMSAKGYSPNSIEYRKGMMEDSYLNCLRATYGYAVTCHKSQGGEWDDVFLFLEQGMYGMPPKELSRWWYTAITRAKESLHIIDGWWIR
ncbi:MAG: ATP-dependent RecD-like DNA helicase [Flavipsychrobacter sp.]